MPGDEGANSDKGAQGQGGAGADQGADKGGAGEGASKTVLDPGTQETAEQKVAREGKEKAEALLKKKVEGKADLKVPDGSPLGLGRLDQIISQAKEKGLTVGEAQALADSQHEAVSAFMTAEKERFKGVSEGWVAELKAHPTLGGEKYAETVAMSHRAITQFGPKGLVEALNSTGLGNHPLLVEAWANIGRAMQDDKFVRPGAGDGPAGPKTDDQKFYGDKYTKKA